jgi:branched-chain amino acid:cation transporter, LIVCS family
MRTLFKFETLAIGLAMFSMFFGAGNVIFPLAVGQYAGDKSLIAMTGLIISAVMIPFAGMIAMILFNGDYKRFFGRLGWGPGFFLALMIMTLLGPLGSTPRCIALSYSTLKLLFPVLSPILFSLGACLFIFLFAIRKNRWMSLLGYVLTPMLLTALGIIIVKGLMSKPDMQEVTISNWSIFLHGFQEGYKTMDLLAAFFFSSAILVGLKKEDGESSGNRMQQALYASIIGATLLAITYIGFSLVASYHSNYLGISEQEDLLGAITLKIIGPSAGLLVCITVVLACLTTAIALSSVFAEFLQNGVFNGKVSYEIALIGSLIVTFFVSTYEFSGISAFLEPILQICYPGLIVLTFLNIAYSLKKVQPVRIPVFLTFAIATVIYLS